MGVSTDGQVCYGILLGEDVELPWSNEPYNDDIDEWWLTRVHGYKPSFELFTKDGNYIGGKEPPKEKISQYFQEKREFAAAHPLPVELINGCSGDYPVWILSAMGKGFTANRGYPVAFEPQVLVATDAERAMLLNFCKTHDVEIGSEVPKWWLSSYYG